MIYNVKGGTVEGPKISGKLLPTVADWLIIRPDMAAELDVRATMQTNLEIIDQAQKLKLWVILGSIHRLTGRHKPHNSLYIISDRGELVDRYDKMFCAGDRSGMSGELRHFSPGSHFSVFDIRGVRCGAICHEYRYPEPYREYKYKGVELMFHSYHAANIGQKRYRTMQK